MLTKSVASVDVSLGWCSDGPDGAGQGYDHIAIVPQSLPAHPGIPHTVTSTANRPSGACSHSS
jgi:hypothetical protein